MWTDSPPILRVVATVEDSLDVEYERKKGRKESNIMPNFLASAARIVLSLFEMVKTTSGVGFWDEQQELNFELFEFKKSNRHQMDTLSKDLGVKS